MGHDDLAPIALYLDDHKDELDQTISGSRDWHYDDVPVCGTASHSQYCPEDKCASSQIPRYRAILSNPHESTTRRRGAVRVLAHLIGDVHQPLHAADNHDRGGNEVFVLLPGATNGVKLHGVWDSTFVNQLYGGKDEEQAAATLIATFKDRAARWEKGNVRAWISESHKIAEDVTCAKLPGFAWGADLEHATIPAQSVAHGPHGGMTAAGLIAPPLWAQVGPATRRPRSAGS